MMIVYVELERKWS